MARATRLTGAGLERAFREEWSAIVASLARRIGLQAAEDAAAEAFAAAARAWTEGMPPNPGGWLMLTARRKAVDQLRRDRTVSVDPELLGAETSEQPGSVAGDDRLAMIVACCHPKAGIRFEVPGTEALAGRLAGVRTVVYLVFNEGYAASSGDELIRAELCEEAIWLGRLLHRLLPADTETAGLLTLMLLHHSRAATRQDAENHAVPLSGQDRSRWDAALIAEGTAVLDAAVARREPGPYQVEAAIAALHAAAPGFEATDWPQIAALYGTLARLTPSPVVEINRAVAVGMADGPQAGLAVLEPVLAAGTLTGYAPLHAAHADLLERLGSDEAPAAWERAAKAVGNAALQRELHRRGHPDAGAGP